MYVLSTRYPKEISITNSTVALAELAKKGADIDVRRQMVQLMAQGLIEIDVEGRCGADNLEKSASAVPTPPRSA